MPLSYLLFYQIIEECLCPTIVFRRNSKPRWSNMCYLHGHPSPNFYASAFIYVYHSWLQNAYHTNTVGTLVLTSVSTLYTIETSQRIQIKDASFIPYAPARGLLTRGG